jgi:hypothetical protein
LIVCRSKLNTNRKLDIDNIIENLKNTLLNLYIQNGRGMGGFRYQRSFNQICTWCTMFSVQAFEFYNIMIDKDDDKLAMDLMEYYI